MLRGIASSSFRPNAGRAQKRTALHGMPADTTCCGHSMAPALDACAAAPIGHTSR